MQAKLERILYYLICSQSIPSSAPLILARQSSVHHILEILKPRHTVPFMRNRIIISRYRRRYLWFFLGLAACMQVFTANTEALANSSATKSLAIERSPRISHDTYILGPGDGLEIELVDLPELSGRFAIGPDGTLYLPTESSLR